MIVQAANTGEGYVCVPIGYKILKSSSGQLFHIFVGNLNYSKNCLSGIPSLHCIILIYVYQ